jgi:hypothetical protein
MTNHQYDELCILTDRAVDCAAGGGCLDWSEVERLEALLEEIKPEGYVWTRLDPKAYKANLMVPS